MSNRSIFNLSLLFWRISRELESIQGAIGNGGGISIVGSSNTNVVLTNTYFRGNLSQNGGALHMTSQAQGAQINLTNSCFVGNTSTSGDQEIFVALDDAIAGQVNFLWLDDDTSNVGIPDLVTGGFTEEECIDPAQFPPQIEQTIEQQLADYGVEFEGPWTSDEKQIILEAVTDVANALREFAVEKEIIDSEVSSKDVFTEIFGSITFEEIDLASGNGNGACNANSFPTIQCDVVLLQARPNDGTEIALTKFALVHELGHGFVSLTGGTVADVRSQGIDEDTGCNIVIAYNSFFSTIVGCDIRSGNADRLIMGDRNINVPPYNRDSNDWWRGDRGWGTHAYPAPSTYQQNSMCVIDEDIEQNPNLTRERKDEILTEEKDEAVADMFLNWVYSTLGNDNEDGRGFENRDYLQGASGEASYGSCPIIQNAISPQNPLNPNDPYNDLGLPGDKRQARVNDAMEDWLPSFFINIQGEQR